MWVVAKIKIKEIQIFKKELIEKFGKEISFYCPKITFKRNFKKNKKIDKFILEGYIFCHHNIFKKNNIISEVQFIKGLQYFLQGHCENQKEIKKFIEYCKSFENEEGYLKPSFFNKMVKRKAQFISGPFTNMMFEIIERQKKKLKVLVGNVIMTISDSTNYLYRPI